MIKEFYEKSHIEKTKRRKKKKKKKKNCTLEKTKTKKIEHCS